MDVLNNEVLTMLIQERKGPCLSIFTPTHREWNEINQDILRFKNLIKKAEETLLGSGISKSEAVKFLDPAHELLNDLEFWNHQKEGLALFISENEFYNLQLPFKFKEGVHLSKRFYTKPLLSVFNGDRDFFILSLDVHNIRLFRAYHYQVREIDLGNMPVNIEDALGLDNDGEKNLQFRTEISTGNTHRANFHGHGTRNDATMRKRDILRFFEMVNDGVINILKNETAPLILAGVENAVPLYREANNYKNLVDNYLKLDADFVQPDDMYDLANTQLDPYYNESIEKELERYGNLFSTGKSSDNPEEIIKAAYENKISVLFVNPEVELWGRFDAANYKADVHDHKEHEDEDLINLAATQTLLRSGTIYTLSAEKIPDNKPMAAIFRY